MAGERRTFSYHRAVAPMLWVLLGLMAVELFVTHLLLAHWWPRVALALSIATLALMLWFARGVARMKALPVELNATQLVWRAGGLRSISVPRGAIAGVRLGGWTRAELRGHHVLNLGLIAEPNVVVDLDEPLRHRGRTIHALAHRLDDPALFAAAWREASQAAALAPWSDGVKRSSAP